LRDKSGSISPAPPTTPNVRIPLFYDEALMALAAFLPTFDSEVLGVNYSSALWHVEKLRLQTRKGCAQSEAGPQCYLLDLLFQQQGMR
jgi:hypothetical protein